MKLKKNIKVISIIAVISIIVIVRLVANKNSFDSEQKLVSESSNVVPVITETVGTKSTNSSFSADGTFSSEKEVSVSSEISAKVINVNAEVGSRVHSGQVLAVLDHSVISIQLQQAKANLQKLEKDLQRNITLVKTDGATEQQVEQSKQAVIDAQATLASLQNQYDNSYIKAPFDGTITKRYIEKGGFLTQGSVVFDLSAMTRLRLVVKVTAELVGNLKKGQKVNITADAFPDKSINGTVYSINEKAGLSKQYEVEISIDNTINNQIKPGMFGKALFSGKEHSNALVIPRVAIPGSIQDAEVYVVKGDSAVIRKISVASLNEKELTVKSGLMEGDVIVVSGQINLSNGTKVKVIK